MRRTFGITRIALLASLTLAVPAHAQVADESAPALTSARAAAAGADSAAGHSQPRDLRGGQQRRHRADSVAQPVRADAGTRSSSAGRLTSIDGDPARFQRYQDLRDGLLFTDCRFVREDPTALEPSTRGADNVGWRDQRYFANYERIGRCRGQRLLGSDPAVLQRRHDDAVHVGGERHRWCSTMRRSGVRRQPQRLRPIAPQFDLRERRDIGTVRRGRDADDRSSTSPAASRRRSTRGELPWGASFGFSNDNEVALPYDSRTNDFDRRRRVDEQPRHDARRLQRLVVRQPRRHADLGQPAAR